MKTSKLIRIASLSALGIATATAIHLAAQTNSTNTLSTPAQEPITSYPRFQVMQVEIESNALQPVKSIMVLKLDTVTGKTWKWMEAIGKDFKAQWSPMRDSRTSHERQMQMDLEVR